MAIRLGVIGETPSLRIFSKVISSYKEFEILVFVNDQEDQHFNLIEKYKKVVDAWLFLEQSVYLKVKRWNGTEKPLYYLHYRSANMYKVFSSMLHKGLKVEQISFDTVFEEDLEIAFGETGIPQKEIYSISDKDGSMDLPDYLEFHKSLYKQGRTKRAITCSWYIKQLLEKEGIPAECVLPLRVTMRHILNTIINDYRVLEMQDKQIAVQIMTFNDFYGSRNYRSADEIYSKKLQLTQKLLNYARQVDGSLKIAEGGDYYIFATRGSLSRLTSGFSKKPDILLMKELGHNLRACGIGMGDSARTAEIHALKALSQAYDKEEGCWYAMLDDHNLLGPFAEGTSVLEEKTSKALQNISSNTGINVMSLYGIMQLEEKKQQLPLNAVEVAAALQILPRSARRLLAVLEEKGYAKVYYAPQHNKRGRPEKLYSLIFPKM